jgi:multimeric flavodoxin WrbA
VIKIVAVCGSPRRDGNTALLLNSAVRGARDAGADVMEVLLRDLKISPCLEIYGCKETGRCVIKDDFQQIHDQMADAHGMILASPIFFYGLSAHTKAFIDRFQSWWVKKYWIDKVPFGRKGTIRKGLFISAGATKGKQLFDGALLTIHYLFDTLDMALWKSLLYRGLDFEGDVLKFPEFLTEAYDSGRALVRAIKADPLSLSREKDP